MEKNLSIVLPTYNERENLEVLIPEIEREVGEHLLEIIIVDDNSKDGTYGLFEELERRYGNLRIIVRPKLNGIGSALRDGYNAALGEYILSSDADQSLAASDMLRMYQKIQEGFDIVIGSRHGESGNYERNSLKIKTKYWVSKLGNWAIRKISGLRIKDYSINFRVIRRDKWLTLHTVENTNALLFEMIMKATRKNYKISEIPISFRERKFGASKLVLWKEAPKFFLKLLKYSFFS